MRESFRKTISRLAVCAAAIMLASCGSDSGDEPEGGNNPGGSAGNTGHAVKHRLERVEYIYGQGERKTAFSNLIYDKEGRLEGYNGQHSKVYTYHYRKDKIEVMIGLDHNSTRLERGYTLEKGRIANRCRYDKENRLIAVVNIPQTIGTIRQDIEWTDGNITKITTSNESDGRVLYTYRYKYSDIPCESLMMCMGYLGDTTMPSPYNALYYIDPVLVEEGYYGNSMVKNLWSEWEHEDAKGEIVRHKLSWDDFANGLPGYALYTWDPSGVEKFWYTWAD